MIKNFLNPEGHQNPMVVQKLRPYYWRGGFGLFVKLHREGSASAACAARLFIQNLSNYHKYKVNYEHYHYYPAPCNDHPAMKVELAPAYSSLTFGNTRTPWLVMFRSFTKLFSNFCVLWSLCTNFFLCLCSLSMCFVRFTSELKVLLNLKGFLYLFKYIDYFLSHLKLQWTHINTSDLFGVSLIPCFSVCMTFSITSITWSSLEWASSVSSVNIFPGALYKII